MTESCMALCPRVAEGALIKNKLDQDIGPVSLNGTVLAGTALVKNEAEWDALRGEPDMLLSVLRKIGLPPSDAPDASKGRERSYDTHLQSFVK
ncbi:ATP adenylyltransferase-domain-containing protein [Xylariaceae sp. FL0662B]|nr:ATP adenylyltransferase-domain-containing protein [Xylariaceae sp. FL0662B]